MKEKLSKKTNVGALSVRNTKKNLPNCAQKGNKGITLVALIITIIVLLILAVVAIRAVQGDGIISHAKNSQKEYEKAQAEEQDLLKQYLYEIDKNTLAPGAYDADGNLIQTWEQLKATGINIEENASNTGDFAKILDSNVKMLVIPEGISKIGGGQLNGASNLEKVIIPGTVKQIYGSAFSNSGLKELILPERT